MLGIVLGTDDEQRRVLAMHRHNTNKNVVESLIVTTFYAEILEDATYVYERARHRNIRLCRIRT